MGVVGSDPLSIWTPLLLGFTPDPPSARPRAQGLDVVQELLRYAADTAYGKKGVCELSSSPGHKGVLWIGYHISWGSPAPQLLLLPVSASPILCRRRRWEVLGGRGS